MQESAHGTANGTGLQPRQPGVWAGSRGWAAPTAEDNPFASRHVRPGAVPFIFPEGVDMAALLRRLVAQRWRGAITGPHGSGKSTLLVQLASELRRRNVPVTVLAHNSAGALQDYGAGVADRILLVDGWEQLSFWWRWRLRWQCRRQGLGLVVTSHRPMHLPVLLATSATVQLAFRIVGELAGPDFATRHDAAIRASFARHSGNLREVLFDLYDRHERPYRIQPHGVLPLCPQSKST